MFKPTEIHDFIQGKAVLHLVACQGRRTLFTTLVAITSGETHETLDDTSEGGKKSANVASHTLNKIQGITSSVNFFMSESCQADLVV